MRLPNGYGSVFKLKGKRRRPWVARRTVGYNDRGQQIFEYVGYYETRAAALEALAGRSDPERRSVLTLAEVFDLYDERILCNRSDHYREMSLSLWQELYLKSLEAVGIDLSMHDVRFVEDNWESPTLGAAGVGWEAWLDGMEITQFTYFQQVGGIEVKPVVLEITYGLERIAMYLQNVDNVYDVMWNDKLKYGDIYLQNEIEQSKYNFEYSSADRLFKLFDLYEEEANSCLEAGIVLPAYDWVLKCSHTFNLLDARGVISKDERMNYILRVRKMASDVAKLYVEQRKELGFPLLK